MNAETGSDSGPKPPTEAEDRPARAEAGSSPSTHKREENAIQARRRRRKVRAEPPVLEQGEPSSPAAARAPSGRPSAKPETTESDPWTVPQSVRDRFVQHGNRFYFPDGAAAFRDLGRKLTTPSENTEVVRSLIEIARARGWSEVKVTGTERFRQEAWQQARLAGLGVRGYQPTHEEQARLVRTLARGLGRSITGEGSPRQAAPEPPESVPPSQGESIASIRRPTEVERLSGILVRHGRANYRHDAREDVSYFVRLQTTQGTRDIWGRDIERALQKSLTQPQIGDEIVLQRSGRDPVTVRRNERDGDGSTVRRPVAAFRTRWTIEKRSFFDERAAAAEIVRNEAVTPQEGVRASPTLAGTYLGIRAAELVADKTLSRLQDRRRFVAKVREALAWGMEHGYPPPRVKVRIPEAERTLQRSSRTREPGTPDIAR